MYNLWTCPIVVFAILSFSNRNRFHKSTVHFIKLPQSQPLSIALPNIKIATRVVKNKPYEKESSFYKVGQNAPRERGRARERIMLWFMCQISATLCPLFPQFTYRLFYTLYLSHSSWSFFLPLDNSPPRFTKQPPTDEVLFKVAQVGKESDKQFVIECEADGEPEPE